MPSLKFGFMPTAKVWQNFTSALDKKFHKLKKSKVFRSIIRRQQPKASGLIIYQHDYAPVFVDELFRDPSTVQPKVPISIVTNNRMAETVQKTKPTAEATAPTDSKVTKVEIKLFDRLVVVETCNEDEKGTTGSAKSIASSVPTQLHSSLYGADAHALTSSDKEKVSSTVSTPLLKLPRQDVFTLSGKEKASTSVSPMHHLHKGKVPSTPASLLHPLRKAEAMSTSTKERISTTNVSPSQRGADALTPSREKKHASFSVPPLHHRGVDERAEEFIAKFKQEMRLQR